jgi:hypothetical protein
MEVDNVALLSWKFVGDMVATKEGYHVELLRLFFRMR